MPCTAGVQGHVDVRRRQARKHAMAPTARSAPLEKIERLAETRERPFPCSVWASAWAPKTKKMRLLEIRRAHPVHHRAPLSHTSPYKIPFPVSSLIAHAVGLRPLVPTQRKCTDLAPPRTGSGRGAPFAAKWCADFQRAAERRLMVTPLSAWEGRKRRFAYRILR